MSDHLFMKGSNMIATYRRLQKQRAAGELDEGFTLIELLIVIIVLGILAAVVVFSLGSVTGKSAVAACQADGATVNTAQAAFLAQNPGGSATQANLLAASSSTLIGGPYLQSWPSNPGHYTFTTDSAGVLSVTGPVGTGSIKTGWAGNGAQACVTSKVQ